MKNTIFNTFLCQLGLAWRPAFIVYKDNDTFLYSVKEDITKTTFTFTDNYRNCKVFEDFEAAYSWVCIYNYSSWAIDISSNGKDNINKLFVMPIEIKGDGNKMQRRMLINEPVINPDNCKELPFDKDIQRVRQKHE